jgi:alanine racemase
MKDVAAVPLTHVKIDLRALAHNIRAIRRLSLDYQFRLPTRPPQARRPKRAHDILAVIKADAYGHGMLEAACVLGRSGVELFGVSDLAEGEGLRRAGFSQGILLFETCLPAQAADIIRLRLTPAVGSLDMARALDAAAARQRRRADLHVKIDTGMGRLGVWYEEAPALVRKIFSLRNVRVMGLMTHFPAADTDRLFTREQIRRVYDIVTGLDKEGLVIPYIHAANSMGLTGYRTHIFNLSRPGLMLYGLYPHPSLKKNIALKPVMSVHSRVIFIKDIPKGQSVSYGRTFFSRKDMTVAVVPAGYHDGYFRALSNKADVLIGGRRCRILGRVTMDQIMVDVTGLSGVRAGSPVVLLGRQGRENVSADELAKKAGTISYEIVCGLGLRLARQYQAER